jgi:hypothetical protein
MRLIGEALDASKDEGVTGLAGHSLTSRAFVTDNELAPFTPHDLRRTGATIVQAARLPGEFVKALLNTTTWHMFEEKRDAVMAIEAAVLPLMPKAKALAQLPRAAMVFLVGCRANRQ